MFKAKWILNRYNSVCALRTAKTKAGNNKINVQLLQDFPSLGIKGNIVSVKPAYMRQTLHPKKIAVYTVDGPRIEVTQRPIKPQVIKEIQEPEENPSTVSLNDLSLMFDDIKILKISNYGQELLLLSNDNISYSASDIRELIPATIILNVDDWPLPITKEHLTKFAYEQSGLEIAPINFKLSHLNKPIYNIDSLGEYVWLIDTPEHRSVTRTISVQ